MGIARVTELLRRLGDPQEQVRCVHIAGTNGKGSVGAMLSSVLTSAGYRTGHFSSPVLCSPCEYFRLNTVEIMEERFAQLLTTVVSCAEQMEDMPTEFELLAAMAYTYFAEEQCDFAVVECCMGGDTDCTNVITHPLLSVITNVQKDHCAYLGDTLAKIAVHKAGIIKAGCPVLCGETHTEAYRPIQERAAFLSAPLYDTNSCKMEHIACTLDGMTFSYGGKRLFVPLAGVYQEENVRTVLCAAEILKIQGISVTDEALQKGLAEVRWQGRSELLCKEPVVLFDGAHNPDGVRQLCAGMQRYFGEQKAVLVIGVMMDKEYAGYADMLKPHICRVFAVQPDTPRALAADRLAEVFMNEGIPAEACAVAEGVGKAYRMAEEQHLPLVGMGSLYLYREFCTALQCLRGRSQRDD